MKQHLRRLLAAVGTLAMLTTAASALSVEQAVDLLEEYYVDDLPQAAYEAETWTSSSRRWATPIPFI